MTLPAGWDTVRRSVQHESLGELTYEGKRLVPGGRVDGFWRVQPAGFSKPISLQFPTFGGEPTPFYLDRLASMLADLDGLFERFRSSIEPVYLQWTETRLPADWRSVMTLDGLDIPPSPEDLDDETREWQATFWCEGVQHWFVVTVDGDKVIDVGVDG